MTATKTMQVLPELYRVDGNTAFVTLEAPTYEELTRLHARRMASDYATERGFAARSHGTQPSPYPVNASGETTKELLNNAEPVAAYRIDYEIRGPVFG